MQTFLPFPDFARCARVLDDRRLGRQRVEVLQILRALHLDGYGWARHPAVTMWRGHTMALVGYGVAIVDEWVARGHRDGTRKSIVEFVHPEAPRGQRDLAVRGLLPPWLGWSPLHRSHRSALLRKDPDHYGPLLPATPDDLPYVWPEPPEPVSPPGDRIAWVVRSEAGGDRVAIPCHPGEHPWTPLAERSGRISKRLRQVARFVEEMRPGDLMVVPRGDRLRLATVLDDNVGHDGHHVRRVRWLGELGRDELAAPAALQDPQEVFVLYAEPIVARRAEEQAGRGAPPAGAGAHGRGR